jgi:hypothetical protein
VVYILSCGQPQIVNEFPFTRIEISLKDTGGHSEVKQLFQVIILPRKLCFVYLITAERDAVGNWPTRRCTQAVYICIFRFLGTILGSVIIKKKPNYILKSFLKIYVSLFNSL